MEKLERQGRLFDYQVRIIERARKLMPAPKKQKSGQQMALSQFLRKVDRRKVTINDVMSTDLREVRLTAEDAQYVASLMANRRFGPHFVEHNPGCNISGFLADIWIARQPTEAQARAVIAAINSGMAVSLATMEWYRDASWGTQSEPAPAAPATSEQAPPSVEPNAQPSPKEHYAEFLRQMQEINKASCPPKAGRKVTVEDVANATGCSVDDVSEAWSGLRRFVTAGIDAEACRVHINRFMMTKRIRMARWLIDQCGGGSDGYSRAIEAMSMAALMDNLPAPVPAEQVAGGSNGEGA